MSHLRLMVLLVVVAFVDVLLIMISHCHEDDGMVLTDPLCYDVMYCSDVMLMLQLGCS